MPRTEIPRLVWMVLPVAAVHFALLEGKFERAKLRPGLAVFSTILSLRVLFAVGPPMFLYAAYEIAVGADRFGDYVLVLTCLGFAVLTIFVQQGSISVSDEGIEFKRWYGLRTRSIPWNSVDSAVSARVPKTITVFSRDGQKIVHTQWHVSPSTFEAVLLRKLGRGFIRQ